MNSPPQPPPVQYGQGQSFQNTCPPFPPPPDGYVVWNTTVNGPVPADVQQQASALAADMTKALGTTVTVYSSGVPVIVRVDPHPFSYDSAGNVVPGCYHGATVYVPAVGLGVTPPAPSSTGGTLFTISLILGAAASAIAIIEHVRRRKPKATAEETDEADEDDE
jgi:hypothetical protein